MTDDREHERLRENISAYVLGSLEAGEAAELEGHLVGCKACAREARWLKPAAAALLESVERVEAPPELRERLMAEVKADDARRRQAERPAERSWSLRGLLLRPAAALAAVVLILGGTGVYLAFLGGDDVTEKEGPSPPGSLIKATLEREGDTGTLELTGLRRLEGERVYQAWVQHGDRMEDSSLFAARADGTATAAIPHDDLVGGDAVLVTIEPNGGSPQPTSQPLVNVPLGD